MKALPLLLCATFVSSALAVDVDPINSKQLLQELETIQTKHEESSTTQQKQRIDTVLRAASSKETAIAFYEDAQMATQFLGANKENGQFRDWKKKEETTLKDPDFRESVRLHLFYLALTLKKAGGMKPEQLAPQVGDYLQVVGNAKEALDVDKSMLQTSVASGIFSKWLGLGPEIAKAEDWELNPGDINKIAETYLLPEWRKEKNPAVVAYWDTRIAREALVATNSRLEFQQKNFATVRKPSLLWKRAQEYVALDQPNRASQEMFSLIKTYPNHPEVAEWIGTLKKQLDPSKI